MPILAHLVPLQPGQAGENMHARLQMGTHTRVLTFIRTVCSSGSLVLSMDSKVCFVSHNTCKDECNPLPVNLSPCKPTCFSLPTDLHGPSQLFFFCPAPFCASVHRTCMIVFVCRVLGRAGRTGLRVVPGEGGMGAGGGQVMQARLPLLIVATMVEVVRLGWVSLQLG